MGSEWKRTKVNETAREVLKVAFVGSSCLLVTSRGLKPSGGGAYKL